MVCNQNDNFPPLSGVCPGWGGFLLGGVMTNQVSYFRIKNYERFQHYQDRRPSWIKLHASLLSDVKFNCLTEVQQIHLVKIWILASQNNNLLPFDPAIIRKRAGLNSRVVLDVFMESGFIEISTRSQRDSNEIPSKPDRDSSKIPPKPNRVEIETEKTKGVTPKIGSNLIAPNKEKYKSNNINQKEKAIPSFPWEAKFAIFYQAHPCKKKKKLAQQRFKATIKTEQRFQDLMRALDNYIAEVEYTRTRPGGYNREWAAVGTWFNEWEDWEDHKVEIHQKRPVDGIYPEQPKSQEEQYLDDEIMELWDAWENESESPLNIQKKAEDILSRVDICLSRSQIDALRYVLEKLEEPAEIDLKEEFVTA